MLALLPIRTPLVTFFGDSILRNPRCGKRAQSEIMSSVDEVKVEEKPEEASSPPTSIAQDGATPVENGAPNDDSVAEKKTVTSESEDDDVVVPKEEKSMESRPERARKTILSEMCDHSKPVQQPPSFKVRFALKSIVREWIIK